MDTTRARQEKRKLLEHFPAEPGAKEGERLFISLAGIPGEIIAHGAQAKENIAFLENYYQRFLTEKTHPQFRVYYTSPDDERSQHEHFLWSSDPHHQFQIRKVRDSFEVIQRDFIGRFDPEKNAAYGLGPSLSMATTDSIDNLLNLLIFHVLPKHRALALHAAAVVIDDEAYLCFGDSGAGKSTLAERAHNMFNLSILAGDQVYLRGTTGGLVAYASPNMIGQMNREKLRWHTGPVPVKALLHLVRGEISFCLTKKSLQGLLPAFMRQIFYRTELSQPEQLLDLTLALLRDPQVILGEMSYSLTINPWNEIKRIGL